MNLEHLKTFIAVAKYKSFSQAGKSLNLSQPAVSHQIQQLEAYYDQKLFDRSNRKIELTQSGEILFDYGKKLLDMNGKLEKVLTEKEQSQIVKIGCSHTIGECMITKVIHDFLKENPSVTSSQIQITIGTSLHITDLLYEGEIEFGLVEGRANRYSFISHELFNDLLVLGFPPDMRWNPEKLSPGKLESFTWLIREQGCQMREATLDFWNSLNIKPQSVLIYNSNSLIKEGVKSGLGVAVFSKLAVCQDVKAKSLLVYSFSDRDRYRPFYLIRKEQTFKSALHKNLWIFLKDLHESPNAC